MKMNHIKFASADEACAFNFSDNQGKHYHKTEFNSHSSVAELVGDLLGRVFYDDENQTWSITPAQLRDIALTNVLQDSSGSDAAYSRYPIYGSAIAFEPGVWTQTNGLDLGVTFPASSMECMKNSSYCESPTDSSALILTELNTNSDGMTLYSPLAFRGPSSMSIYEKCSHDTPEYCPSVDLAFAYDYSNITTTTAEWYNAPRCLYLRDGIRTGYWTSPYFDAGGGNINMVTHSQPIISQSGKFLGVATIDISVDALCYGQQCNFPVNYNYLTNIRPAGFTFVAISMALSLSCGLWTYMKRKDKVVMASQPIFMAMICVGCFILASAIIPLSIDDSIASPDGCSKACMAFPWLLSIGFTTTFSALSSKTWRLNRVVENSRRMKRVIVKELDAILPCAILMTINCAIMLAWTLVDPLIWVRTVPNDAYVSLGYCQESKGAGVIFKVLIVAVNLVALVTANVEAFLARNISSEFSDSFNVMMTMLSLLQALIIGIPLLILVQDNHVATYFIWCGMIFVMTTAILGLMFISKILLVKERAKYPPERSSRRMTISLSTGPPRKLSLPPQSITELCEPASERDQNDLRSFVQ